MRQIESFFWGIIAALGALVVQLVVYIGFTFYANGTAINVSFSQLFAIPAFIIIGVFIEESFKYLIVSKKIETFSQDRSYLTNSIFLGLGFFITELGLIFLSTTTFQFDVLREIAIIHIGSAGLIGYIVAMKNPKKISTFLYAVLVTSFFHGAYNLLIIQRTFVTNYAIFILLTILVLLNIFNLLFINRRLAQD
jgi:hypothetical protein